MKEHNNYLRAICNGSVNNDEWAMSHNKLLWESVKGTKKVKQWKKTADDES